jgi:hypothetical protein
MPQAPRPPIGSTPLGRRLAPAVLRASRVMALRQQRQEHQAPLAPLSLPTLRPSPGSNPRRVPLQSARLDVVPEAGHSSVRCVPDLWFRSHRWAVLAPASGSAFQVPLQPAARPLHHPVAVYFPAHSPRCLQSMHAAFSDRQDSGAADCGTSHREPKCVVADDMFAPRQRESPARWPRSSLTARSIGHDVRPCPNQHATCGSRLDITCRRTRAGVRLRRRCRAYSRPGTRRRRHGGSGSTARA